MEHKRRTIIIVDDINYCLQTVRGRLKEDYRVYTAQKAEELFELLETVEPELILLDIAIPVTDGFEIIKQLKNDARYSNIPVIFLSAKSDKDSITKGMSLGAIDFITKPFRNTALIECIENHLDPGRYDAIKPVIIAIDDNPSMLRSIKSVLCDEYKVYTLTEPLSLSEVLKKVTPDLFLLDCLMPEITGFDLVPVIRSILRHKETPILFLTSEGTSDYVHTAQALGSAGFIVKPVDGELLKQKVKEALANYMTLRLTHYM